MTDKDLHPAAGPSVVCSAVNFGDDHDFDPRPAELNPEGYDEYERCERPAADSIHGAFVRVGMDKETGNVVIGLNPLALDGLRTIFDSADLHEMTMNPDYKGLSKEDGDLAAHVGFAILEQLRKLSPYRYY